MSSLPTDLPVDMSIVSIDVYLPSTTPAHRATRDQSRSVTSVGGTVEFLPEVAAPFSSGGFSNIFPRPFYQNGAVDTYLGTDRKSTRLNSSHSGESRMPSSA